MAVIEVKGVSKRYRKGQAGYRTLREDIYDLSSKLIRLGKGDDSGFIWALRDVSFEVSKGERVGIIGRNGSGKTTMLRLLAGITKPTQGTISLQGRMGVLIELMAGFHPELTGRENVYLNGAIMGLSRKEIQGKFDEIVSFAELEEFIDTPIKRYSSGMHVRLGFAVAAHLEPDILLVDEVLAVGDAAFQKKCLGKMGEVTHEGRTVLFVSHNMLAVQGLCPRTIWLQDGKLVADDQTDRVISKYLDTGSSGVTANTWDDVNTAPGNDKVRLHAARVRPLDGSSSDPITVQTPFVMEFEYWNLEPGAHLNLSLLLYNEQGIVVFNTGPVNEPVWHGKPFPKGLFRSACLVPGSLLNDGTYRVELLVVRDQSVIIYQHDSVLTFSVNEALETREGAWYGKWPGAVRPNLDWTTDLIGGQ
jgi:lipopolysaccharide transport system ATP-binding protein